MLTADDLREYPKQKILEALKNLTPDQSEALLHDWDFWARPSQRLPEGDWTYWLIMAGRGFGKTRTGSECVRIWVRKNRYVNIIAPTKDDARDIMVEGESGILASCPKNERPYYAKHESKLVWPNGAKTLILSADEPDRIRGKQHTKLWCDELAAWRYPEAWTQARFGLRIGRQPQAVLTTTPRPIQMLKDLIKDENTIITRGSTYDNMANLSRPFYSSIITVYEGTRLGRQEIEGELITDNPLSLFTRDKIDEYRIDRAQLPTLRRVVVGVDPSASSSLDSDECGICVCGVATDNNMQNHGYCLHDGSGIMPVSVWSKRAVELYHAYECDVIVAEANQGGDMVSEVIRNVDPNVPVRLVHASRGKVTRAEPISALAANGFIHHVGAFRELEDQLCEYDPMTWRKSPDRFDAYVWAFTELFNRAGDALMAFYANSMRKPKTEPIEDRKIVAEETPAPLRSRVLAAPAEHEDNDVEKAYNRANQAVTSNEVCAVCKQPVKNERITDGFNVWHPQCKPSW